MSFDPEHLSKLLAQWFPSFDDPWVHRAPDGGDVAICGVIRHPIVRAGCHVDDNAAPFVCPTCDPEKPQP